jgi:hypothetical protein
MISLKPLRRFDRKSGSCREAAINLHARAGDVTGFGAGEIRNQAGDLIALAVALI